jgi:Na+/proline symporter
VFATWFGAEAVLGISATFVKEGLRGVVADPFGSSMCLILAGLFFAPRLYRLNILTVGDYYRLRYDRTVETLCTLCIVASYVGWVAAQFKVLGLVLNVVTGGAISQPLGIIIGAAIVLTYTTFGGMFSVAILDFVQISVIMGGLLYITSVVSGLAGGVGAVIDHAAAAGKLDFFPPATLEAWIPFIGAWMTMMLGSVPQQDVFHRITSAKDEGTAVRGSLQVQRVAGARFTAGSADTDHATHSDRRSDHVLRRRPVGRHELFERHAIGAVGGVERKRHSSCAGSIERLGVPSLDAGGPGRIRLGGVDHCAVV